jgi:hypothetical protein
VRNLLRGAAARWKLKLSALALALLLWVVFSAEQVTTQWIPVRVEAVVRDPGYVLTGRPEPSVVRVRFRGPGRELWEVALRPPTLVLHVRDVGAARSFALDPAMVEVPERFRVTATDVRPAVVRLDLQRLATRTVPVRPVVASASLARYVVDDSVRATPPTVRLTGPEEALSQLDAIPTRAFEIVPTADGEFSRRVALDTTDLEGVTLSHAEVRVHGRVDRRVERAFPGVSIDLPSDLAATPARVDVHVSGGERQVGARSPADVRAVIRRDSLPPVIPPLGVDAAVVVGGIPANATARTVPVRVRVTPSPTGPAAASPGGAPAVVVPPPADSAAPSPAPRPPSAPAPRPR